MARDGTRTRASIMDAAEALILDHGFAATSIDRLIERAGVTKGAFFYHFDSKQALARALVERFAEQDAASLERTMMRAESLARDPLQQVLIFVRLFREEAETLVEPYPGCLFASYVYEAQLFDAETHAIIERAMRMWRERFGAKLAKVIERYPPRLPASAAGLADMITVVFEGAFILSKITKDPTILAEQIGYYGDYLELLFRREGESRPGLASAEAAP